LPAWPQVRGDYACHFGSMDGKVPEGSSVVFKVEVLSIEEGPSQYKMSWGEKREWALKVKEAGNSYIKVGPQPLSPRSSFCYRVL